MESIKTYTAPQSTLVELILLRNDMPVKRSSLVIGENTYDEFFVSDVTPDWLDEQLKIQRRALRHSPETYVTFENMALQTARSTYDANSNNVMLQQDQLKGWIKEISDKSGDKKKAAVLLQKVAESNQQNVMDVFQDVLAWEAVLD